MEGKGGCVYTREDGRDGTKKMDSLTLVIGMCVARDRHSFVRLPFERKKKRKVTERDKAYAVKGKRQREKGNEKGETNKQRAKQSVSGAIVVYIRSAVRWDLSY